MGMIINTNVMALNAQRNLSLNNTKLARALEKLSSGLRINRAADDAAGLAISEKMRTQIRGMRQAARNGQDAISMVQIAEGALSGTHAILQRMRELTVQAGNDTLSDSDRDAIGAEIFTLKSEIDNIASRTTFNGLNLLTGDLSTSQSGGTAVVGVALTAGANGTASIGSIDVSKLAAGTTYTLTKIDADTITIDDLASGGSTTVSLDNTDGTIGVDGELSLSFSGAINATIRIVGPSAQTVDDLFTDLNTLTVVTGAGSGSANFRVGASTGDNITVQFDDMRTAVLGSGGANDLDDLVTSGDRVGASVDNVANANVLLTSVDDAITQVSATRAKLGAAQNQVEAAVNSLGMIVENLSASESRIRDADIAEVSSDLVARQIMQQAGVAVLAQANVSSQSVLQLLQG